MKILIKSGVILIWGLNVPNEQKGAFWNPVKVFIRFVLRKWEKDDNVSGERYLIDSEDVMRDLDDSVDDTVV